ncbi:MAG: VOC family protein [Acidimicrobiales bacterium]
MSHQLEMGYVVLEVADPAPLNGFFTEVIGLAPGGPAAHGASTFTDDRAVHRVIVGEGEANDLVAVGIEAIDPDAFDATVARLQEAGLAPREDDERRAARRVERLAAVEAPWGATLEVVTGLERTDEPAPTPLVPGGFVTEGQGFGHVVIATTAFDDSVRFVTDGLGMAQSDWIQTELAPGIELEVRFFHCNARHHSLALARAPFELPQRLHHLMFETSDSDDVGRAFDRAVASGRPIPNGLGRHDNDRMFSFYVESPAGFQVEVGHGARRIEQPWSDDRRYDRISAWGHQPVAPASPAGG